MDGCAPHGIITDRDRAMKNAIQIIFLNTRHRWCLWHIMKKLSEKLRRYTQYEHISSTMKRAVYDTQSTDEFENHWNEMIDTYALENMNGWLDCTRTESDGYHAMSKIDFGQDVNYLAKWKYECIFWWICPFKNKFEAVCWAVWKCIKKQSGKRDTGRCWLIFKTNTYRLPRVGWIGDQLI